MKLVWNETSAVHRTVKPNRSSIFVSTCVESRFSSMKEKRDGEEFVNGRDFLQPRPKNRRVSKDIPIWRPFHFPGWKSLCHRAREAIKDNKRAAAGPEKSAPAGLRKLSTGMTLDEFMARKFAKYWFFVAGKTEDWRVPRLVVRPNEMAPLARYLALGVIFLPETASGSHLPRTFSVKVQIFSESTWRFRLSCSICIHLRVVLVLRLWTRNVVHVLVLWQVGKFWKWGERKYILAANFLGKNDILMKVNALD